MAIHKVFGRLFISSADEYEQERYTLGSWAIVHAAKYPYHRDAVGYPGRSAPLGPTYYYIVKGLEMSVNIVDAKDEAFFSKKMMDGIISFSCFHYLHGKNVLIHCNQGQSRAPILVLLVAKQLGLITSDFFTAERNLQGLYPSYSPNEGIRNYAIHHWEDKVARWEDIDGNR
jgi:hypothetical protein